MQGRGSNGSGGYRYSFNGMEKDDEIKGTGNSYDFGARIYDPRLGRWLSLDPHQKKYPNLNPYNAFENNPLYFNDKDGKDAGVSIKGHDITITSQIYIYGSGASKAQAASMQANIMGAWATNSGKSWTYTDKVTGDVYNVKFDVKVNVYDNNNPTNNPFIIPDAWNPFSTNNYIEIGASAKDVKRSYVREGDAGAWRGYGSDPSAHEFGHTIGLGDQYTDAKGPNPGWNGNIMAEAPGQGIVEQKNIDAIVKDLIGDYKESDQYQNGKGQVFTTKIDNSNMDKESMGCSNECDSNEEFDKIEPKAN